MSQIIMKITVKIHNEKQSFIKFHINKPEVKVLEVFSLGFCLLVKYCIKLMIITFTGQLIMIDCENFSYQLVYEYDHQLIWYLFQELMSYLHRPYNICNMYYKVYAHLT